MHPTHLADQPAHAQILYYAPLMTFLRVQASKRMAGAVLGRLLGGGGADCSSWQAACVVNRLREESRPL